MFILDAGCSVFVVGLFVAAISIGYRFGPDLRVMNRGAPRLSKPSLRDLSGMELDGRYRLVRLVGAGGMGSVYEGQHIVLGTQVAIKVLKPDLCADEKFRMRFLREARAASAIPNKHIVRATDFGTTPSGLVYFVMDFLVGRDLQDVLSEVGRLSWGQFRPILLQIIDALAAAHERAIVHRDIKPANIFLALQDGDPSFVKVLDFGIAKMAADGWTGLTAVDELFGTVSYMAPELAVGKKATAASDIYSLGVLMYYALTGLLPFGEGTPFQILAKHIQQSPRPPRQLVPEIPESVEATILAMMTKQPAQRPSRLHHVLEHLEHALDQSTAAAQTSQVSAIPESTRTTNPEDTDFSRVCTLVAIPSPASGHRTEPSPPSKPPVPPMEEGPAITPRHRTGTMPSAVAARVARTLATSHCAVEATLVAKRPAPRPEGLPTQVGELVVFDEYERKVRARRRLAGLVGVSVATLSFSGVVAAIVTGGFRDVLGPTKENIYNAGSPVAAEIRSIRSEGERSDDTGVARSEPSPSPTDQEAKDALRAKIPSECKLEGHEYFVGLTVDEEGLVEQFELTGFEGDEKSCALEVIREQDFQAGRSRLVTLTF